MDVKLSPPRRVVTTPPGRIRSRLAKARVRPHSQNFRQIGVLVCMFVCVCVYVCMRVCVCLCVYMCISVYVYVYKCGCMFCV